jgi:hypothetical protein
MAPAGSYSEVKNQREDKDPGASFARGQRLFCPCRNSSLSWAPGLAQLQGPEISFWHGKGSAQSSHFWWQEHFILCPFYPGLYVSVSVYSDKRSVYVCVCVFRVFCVLPSVYLIKNYRQTTQHQAKLLIDNKVRPKNI